MNGFDTSGIICGRLIDIEKEPNVSEKS